MNLHQACANILDQLSHFVEQIKQQDFCKPVKALNQATIGQHVRHTIEFFICLERGCASGKVNYDKRNHDRLIETDKLAALNVLTRIKNFVLMKATNKPLLLEVNYDYSEGSFTTIETNLMRELAYNIEHAIHHMAIIRIGVHDSIDYVSLPADFGVAPSTVRHHETRVPASR